MSSRAIAVALAALLVTARAEAVDQPIDAVKLVLRKTASGEKLAFVSRDENFLFPPVGSADDPATGVPGGAVLELFSANEGLASLVIPADEGTPGWIVSEGTVSRFAFRNADAPDGPTPVRLAILKEGRVLKVVAKGTGLALTGPQLAIGVRFTTGTRRSCALFDAATIQRDEEGRFVGRGALASSLTDCSNQSLTRLPCGIVNNPEPTCGGECPPGDACVEELDASLTVGCKCSAADQPACSGSGYPECGGACSNGLQCQATHVIASELPADFTLCVCVDPADTCDDPPGTCAGIGVCPTGEVCVGEAPPTNACGCAAP